MLAEITRQTFPKTSKLHKIFNRNSVKVSYSCMSIKRQEHYIKPQRQHSLTRAHKTCNCRGKNECPVLGKWLAEYLVYWTTDTHESKNYDCDSKNMKQTFNTTLKVCVEPQATKSKQNIHHMVNFQIGYWQQMQTSSSYRLVSTWCLQTCCTFLKQLASRLWTKGLDIQTTCSNPVDNLQQNCYHQAGASDADASWYRLDARQQAPFWWWTVFGYQCVVFTIWHTQKLNKNNFTHESTNHKRKNTSKAGESQGRAPEQAGNYKLRAPNHLDCSTHDQDILPGFRAPLTNPNSRYSAPLSPPLLLALNTRDLTIYRTTTRRRRLKTKSKLKTNE